MLQSIYSGYAKTENNRLRSNTELRFEMYVQAFPLTRAGVGRDATPAPLPLITTLFPFPASKLETDLGVIVAETALGDGVPEAFATIDFATIEAVAFEFALPVPVGATIGVVSYSYQTPFTLLFNFLGGGLILVRMVLCCEVCGNKLVGNGIGGDEGISVDVSDKAKEFDFERSGVVGRDGGVGGA